MPKDSENKKDFCYFNLRRTANLNNGEQNISCWRNFSERQKWIWGVKNYSDFLLLEIKSEADQRLQRA